MDEPALERELAQAGLVAKAVCDRVPADLERAILHAVLVHGYAGRDLDDVTAQVRAGSVRLKLYGPDRVRVSWAELIRPGDPGSSAVLTGAWASTEQIRNVIERWQSGKRVNGRTYGHEAGE